MNRLICFLLFLFVLRTFSQNPIYGGLLGFATEDCSGNAVGLDAWMLGCYRVDNSSWYNAKCDQGNFVVSSCSNSDCSTNCEVVSAATSQCSKLSDDTPFFVKGTCWNQQPHISSPVFGYRYFNNQMCSGDPYKIYAMPQCSGTFMYACGEDGVQTYKCNGNCENCQQEEYYPYKCYISQESVWVSETLICNATMY